MHLTPKSVLGSMREAITDVKRLLAGETLTQAGAYYGYDAVSLTHPAPELKVLGAAVGPKSVDLCAEIADGMVISVLAGPRYVATVKERIARVRRAQGLPEDFALVVYALASVDADREAARAKVRPATAFYLEAMGPTLITGVYDANEALVGMIDAGGAAELEAGMADDWLDWACGCRASRRLPRRHRGALRRRRDQGGPLASSPPKNCRHSWRYSGARCCRASDPAQLTYSAASITASAASTPAPISAFPPSAAMAPPSAVTATVA